VCVLIMFGLTILWWNVEGTLYWQSPQGWIGRGELAFSVVSGASSGSAVLGGTTGYLGWLVFVAGLLAALVRVVVRGRWNRTAFFWITATALSTLAILAPGGYFLPITAVTFALTWGLLPRIGGAPISRASGLFVVAAMLLLAMLLGLTRKVGLLMTISHVYELSDKQSHGIFGFLLAIVLAWWFGAKRAWLGAIGIVVAVLIGGLGEVAQRFVGLGRAFELADWRAHSIGAAIATAPVILCFLARYGTPKRVGQFVARYKKIPAQCSGALLLILALTATVGWMGLSVWRTVESWNRKRPWFVVSDGIQSLGRDDYYLRGVIKPAPPAKADLLMTVSNNGILDVIVSRERIFAKLMGKEKGLHLQSVLGQPFGELSTRRQQTGRFILIDKASKLYVVDVGMVISRRRKQGADLDAALAELRKKGTVVIFDTGQPYDYWRLRPILEVRYPETPCFVMTPAPKHSTDVLNRMRHYTGSKIVVFTADVNLAKAAQRRLGRGGEVHLIDPETTPGSLGRNLTVHPSLNAFLHPYPSTLPSPDADVRARNDSGTP
jgi:hypothetical protein